MKELLTVMTITILLHQIRAQGCETDPPKAYCSNVTFENGNPVTIGADNSSIEEIMIFESHVTSIPSGIFSNFTNLKILSLHMEASIIEPGAFNGVTHLTDLNLRENNFKEIPKGVLTNLTELEVLDLDNNKITVISLETLNLPTSLTFLDLSWNHIKFIKPGSLDSLINLKHLDLNSNFIGRLQPGTFNSLTNLMHLNLETNLLTKVDEYSFKNLRNLEYLNLEDNFLTQTIIEKDSFKDLSKLVELNLQYNHLPTLEPDLFQNLQNLETLELNYNKLTLISKKMLEKLTKLKVLLVDHNNITSIDAQCISSTLPNLVHISLNNNALQCESLPKIIEIFENHNVTIIRNDTNTFPNVYGINCVCNSEQGDLQESSSTLNTRIPIQGCKTVNKNNGAVVNNRKPEQKLSNDSGNIKSDCHMHYTKSTQTPQNVKSGKNNATENKLGKVHASTEQTDVEPQNNKFEQQYKELSDKIATVNVITITISITAAILLITLVSFCINRYKKRINVRNVAIGCGESDFLTANIEV